MLVPVSAYSGRWTGEPDKGAPFIMAAALGALVVSIYIAENRTLWAIHIVIGYGVGCAPLCRQRLALLANLVDHRAVGVQALANRQVIERMPAMGTSARPSHTGKGTVSVHPSRGLSDDRVHSNVRRVMIIIHAIVQGDYDTLGSHRLCIYS